jgi:hypothetical protein
LPASFDIGGKMSVGSTAGRQLRQLGSGDADCNAGDDAADHLRGTYEQCPRAATV